ncbi:MAG: ribonuclease E/G [Phenylobacterium sp.]|uniref:ribonuclease E/G n=1 Tax=Phenylobacterium sp. TaxID=1871053 RepID=UPI00271D2D8C|nr:ribonuclease E/G [Phenylobacterium sp.]MDO8900154.1 ribonuclease E/G [Phenylobacterium sp.]
MSRRTYFIDRGLGETRGGVLLDGRPERLLIQRDDDSPRLALGARLRARVRHVEPALGMAFLDLGAGDEASVSFKPDERPRQGEALEVEIRTEPRIGKLATARLIGPAQGEPVLLESAPSLLDQLQRLVGEGEPVTGRVARQLADEAEAEVLEVIHPLPGGGTIAIEPTRALTAIDVDVGERKGQEAKRVTRQANLAALSVAARVLRLKGLGGLIVFDMAGRGHDGAALMAAARAAFNPDNPGVSIGPISRFGTIELTVPRRGRPVTEILTDGAGRVSARTLGHRLVRRLEAEGTAAPGGRLSAACSPAVAEAAKPALALLAGRIGARFEVKGDPALAWEQIEVHAR